MPTIKILGAENFWNKNKSSAGHPQTQRAWIWFGLYLQIKCKRENECFPPPPLLLPPVFPPLTPPLPAPPPPHQQKHLQQLQTSRATKKIFQSVETRRCIQCGRRHQWLETHAGLCQGWGAGQVGLLPLISSIKTMIVLPVLKPIKTLLYVIAISRIQPKTRTITVE